MLLEILTCQFNNDTIVHSLCRIDRINRTTQSFTVEADIRSGVLLSNVYVRNDFDLYIIHQLCQRMLECIFLFVPPWSWSPRCIERIIESWPYSWGWTILHSIFANTWVEDMNRRFWNYSRAAWRSTRICSIRVRLWLVLQSTYWLNNTLFAIYSDCYSYSAAYMWEIVS